MPAAARSCTLDRLTADIRLVDEVHPVGDAVELEQGATQQDQRTGIRLVHVPFARIPAEESLTFSLTGISSPATALEVSVAMRKSPLVAR